VDELPRPDPARLDPKLIPWKSGRRLFRVHPGEVPATSFNPGYGRGRFHPIATPEGVAIPTLYAADRINGALAETVFRDVTGGGLVQRAELKPLVLSRLILEQDLELIDLTGLAARRVGLNGRALLDAPPRSYGRTRAWAAALHAASPTAHGLVWISRQYDTARAVLLFGDRFQEDWLGHGGNPEALCRGIGLRRVCKAASLADITLVY
jgi:hypothetical protein